MKKPAQLGENLLSIRPRKGLAKPQSEGEAEGKSNQEPLPGKVPARARRRRRVSDKTMQLNLRVSEASLARFNRHADEEGLIFGDLFEQMLDAYDRSKK